jgi:hypothetical protein
MKTIIIAIAGFLIISGTGVGAWLLMNKDTITDKVNDAKNSAVQSANDAKDEAIKNTTEAAKQKILDEAAKYKPEGMCGQAMTPARHKATGVQFTFPSTCLPSGWEKV